MQRLGRLFRRDKKPSDPIITFKKMVFYGLFVGFGVMTFSKNYKTQIIFSCETNKENQKLINKNYALKKNKFQPTVFLYFGFLQNIFASYFEKQRYIRTEDEVFEGNLIKKVPTHQSILDKEIPVPLIIIISGSQGFNEATISAMLTLYRRKFEVIGVELKDLHDINNLHRVIEKCKSQTKHNNVYGVGFEYGANILVNYTAKNEKTFKGLISVGNPLNLAVAQRKLQNSWMAKLTFYNSMIKGRMKNTSQTAQTLYDVDAKLYNLKDDSLRQWKDQHSSINSIKNLKTRTMFIQSQEDPFCIPLEGEQGIENPLCIYVQTQRGGHNEWFQSNSVVRWVNEPIFGFLRVMEE